MEEQAKPKTLFHYTKQAGLDGILSNKCIWATHYRFLNDSMERQHGLDAYEKAIFSIALENYGFEESAKTLVEYILRSSTNALDAYIVSFCSSYPKEIYQKGLPIEDEDRRGGDRLSQWRGYSTGGVGYCLAFDFELMQQIQCLSANRCYHGFCRYSQDSISQMAEAHVRELFVSQLLSVEDLQNNKSLSTALKRDQARTEMMRFKRDMLTLCGVLKHVGFQEENEYRLIKFVLQSSPNTEEVHFRPDNAPYIDLPLNLLAENSPLRAIFVGPTANRDQAASILRIRLRQMGLSHVEVIPSDIPYRG
jgi:hypothetical protein